MTLLNINQKKKNYKKPPLKDGAYLNDEDVASNPKQATNAFSKSDKNDILKK
jgi:hypothetical protein